MPSLKNKRKPGLRAKSKKTSLRKTKKSMKNMKKKSTSQRKREHDGGMSDMNVSHLSRIIDENHLSSIMNDKMKKLLIFEPKDWFEIRLKEIVHTFMIQHKIEDFNNLYHQLTNFDEIKNEISEVFKTQLDKHAIKVEFDDNKKTAIEKFIKKKNFSHGDISFLRERDSEHDIYLSPQFNEKLEDKLKQYLDTHLKRKKREGVETKKYTTEWITDYINKNIELFRNCFIGLLLYKTLMNGETVFNNIQAKADYETIADDDSMSQAYQVMKIVKNIVEKNDT